MYTHCTPGSRLWLGSKLQEHRWGGSMQSVRPMKGSRLTAKSPPQHPFSKACYVRTPFFFPLFSQKRVNKHACSAPYGRQPQAQGEGSIPSAGMRYGRKGGRQRYHAHTRHSRKKQQRPAVEQRRYQHALCFPLALFRIIGSRTC